MIGFAIGFPMVLYGVQQFEANDWSMEYSFFQGHQYNWWGSLFISFGYLCGVMLLCQHSGLVKLLAPVGQMALTNYLLQTIICTLVFYGHGLGWFGSLNRIELIGVVVAVWFLQIVLSSVWLSRFRFGPFEWFWRSLTYWKLQPVVKSESWCSRAWRPVAPGIATNLRPLELIASIARFEQLASQIATALQIMLDILHVGFLRRSFIRLENSNLFISQFQSLFICGQNSLF